jgi:hypothetical protein
MALETCGWKFGFVLCIRLGCVAWTANACAPVFPDAKSASMGIFFFFGAMYNDVYCQCSWCYWHSLNVEVCSQTCCPSIWIDSASTDTIFTKFSIVDLVLKSVLKIQIVLKSDGNNRHLTWRHAYISDCVLWVQKWPWLPCLLKSSQLILWLTWLPSLQMLRWLA